MNNIENLAPVEGQIYYIECQAYPNHVFDVAHSSQLDGAPILLWPSHNGANQQFILTAEEDDYYCILNVNSQKVADWSGKMLQWKMWPADHQRFKLNPKDNGYYTIEFKKEKGYVIEGVPQEGLVLKPANGHPAQLFRFVKP